LRDDIGHVYRFWVTLFGFKNVLWPVRLTACEAHGVCGVPDILCHVLCTVWHMPRAGPWFTTGGAGAPKSARCPNEVHEVLVVGTEEENWVEMTGTLHSGAPRTPSFDSIDSAGRLVGW
jgi:hypothetical protein